MDVTPNIRAFIDMIGMSEGTANSPLTKAGGYDVIVTGIDAKGRPTPEVFTDFSHHPFAGGRAPKVINGHGLESTASGKAQILLHWWMVYQKEFGYPDFSPASQDLYCIQQFRERGALPLLAANDFYGALIAVSGLWASLPGKAYVGQHQHAPAQALKWYADAGGKSVPMVVVKSLTAQPSPQGA